MTSAVQPAQTARLKGHIPAWAASAADQGSVSGSTQLNNLHLVLSRAPEVQAAFESLLADLYNPSSPRYHQWLTPQQNAAQFGIAPSDLQAVKDWLNSQGLRVDDVAAGGVFITFSGPSSAVERAFSTTLHNFAHDGLSLRAPVQEPAVPTALAGVIQSIAGLDDTRMKQHSTPRKLVMPKSNDNGSSQPDLNASNGAHFLSPGDFNIIYDVTGAAAAGYTGTGQKVLVLGYSRIAATDITNFETYFSLGVSTQPTTYLLSGSADPGMDGVMGWQGENTLDVERVIGTAPGAAVDLSIAATSSYTIRLASCSGTSPRRTTRSSA